MSETSETPETSTRKEFPNNLLDFPDGDVEIVFTPQDIIHLPSSLLSQASPWFRKGLEEPWLENKLTDVCKHVRGNTIYIKRYSFQYDCETKDWFLIGAASGQNPEDRSITRKTRRSANTGASGDGANEENDENVNEQEELRQSVIRGHKFLFALICLPTLQHYFRSLADTTDTKWIVHCAELYHCAQFLGSSLDQFIIDIAGFREDLMEHPCQYIVMATRIRSERLYKMAMARAAGKALVEQELDVEEFHSVFIENSRELKVRVDLHCRDLQLELNNVENQIFSLRMTDLHEPRDRIHNFVKRAWKAAFTENYLSQDRTNAEKISTYREIYLDPFKLLPLQISYFLLGNSLGHNRRNFLHELELHSINVEEFEDVLEAWKQLERRGHHVIARLFRHQELAEVYWDARMDNPISCLELPIDYTFPWQDETTYSRAKRRKIDE